MQRKPVEYTPTEFVILMIILFVTVMSPYFVLERVAPTPASCTSDSCRYATRP